MIPEPSKSILVVDDEQNMRIALYEALSRNGYQVTCVSSRSRKSAKNLGRAVEGCNILDTNQDDVKLVIIRATDVPTYVQYGAAEVGVAGKDVLMELYRFGMAMMPGSKSLGRKGCSSLVVCMRMKSSYVIRKPDS